MPKKEQKYISIKGARLHNLKDVDVDIPRNKLTVITGVSGSGKSSLAFNTLYAEGQRRFVESLSSYARQFLERMHKPDVNSITGLPPAVAIEQHAPQKNPRSTIGTTTEIYDYLRVLFGRIGRTYCYKCGKEVKKDSASSITAKIMKFKEGAKLYILFPFNPQAKIIKNEIEELKKNGFFRLINKKNMEIIDLEGEGLPKDFRNDELYVLADRLIIRDNEETATRIADSVEMGLKFGENRVAVYDIDNKKLHKYSTIYECAEDEIVYIEPDPKLFSFNNPHGACPNCQGFGRTVDIDDMRVIPDRSLSIVKDALHPFRGDSFSQYQRQLIKIAPKYGIDTKIPVSEFTDEQWKIIWEGADSYIGLDNFFKMLEEKNYKMHYRILHSRYRGYTKCKQCGGSRLRTSARQVFINGKNIPELIETPLEKVYEYISNIELNEYEQKVSSQLLIEIKQRVKLLVDIGLEYLTMGRLSHTLSGGEAQRISLATALGSSLVGTLYVLDEPSIGMHPRDTERLLNILFKLRDLGNTVVVVEHDPEVIRNADNVIDMGPNAGEHGGQVIFSGTVAEILKDTRSLTGMYLRGDKKFVLNGQAKNDSKDKLIVHKPRLNNLKMDSVEFPLKNMTVVTGVSGSGKSTLVHDILYSGIKREAGQSDGQSGKYDKIEGVDLINNIELVDQSPIGKSSRSTPATYTKIFDDIRAIFANTQLSRQLGLKPGYFSFNVAGGRCEVCEGEGQVTVEMQFLPDVTLECESCKGDRYKKEAKGILHKGKSIVDVLEMTIDEATKFFSDFPKIVRKLNILQDVGLGYIRLGQPSTMLSGGEAQRIKLAGHLDHSNTQNSLFIFDEPTTGLHMDDISKLLKCFRKLVKNNHSVIIIEHNIHIIAAADHIIDLGPEAGEKGGEIVAEGTPREIAEVKESFTGIALKEFLESNLS